MKKQTLVEALRAFIMTRHANSQEEIRAHLEALGYEINQMLYVVECH
jgi:arginine repressor